MCIAHLPSISQRNYQNVNTVTQLKHEMDWGVFFLTFCTRRYSIVYVLMHVLNGCGGKRDVAVHAVLWLVGMWVHSEGLEKQLSRFASHPLGGLATALTPLFYPFKDIYPLIHSNIRAHTHAHFQSLTKLHLGLTLPLLLFKNQSLEPVANETQPQMVP